MRTVTKEKMKKFRLYLYENEKSENTINKYMRDVVSFSQYIGKNSIKKADMLEYKKLLCEKYAPRSVNSMLSSINAFFDYLEWHELKVKTLKIQKQIFSDKESELTKSEYERLLSVAKARKKERIYYLIQTVGSTGLRISELKYITVDAVKSGQAVINCKGKIRRVFLPNLLCKMLKEYIKSRNIKSGPVFVTKNGKPLDRSNIWRMLKALCRSAGVPNEKVFPHNLRHLFARTYYSMQKDIVRLADVLGHSNINTTRIYTIESGDVHIKHLQKLGLLRQ